MKIENTFLNSIHNLHHWESRTDCRFMILIDTITQLASQRRSDAGFAGSHSDNGASAMVDKLNAFLAGVYFHETGLMEEAGYKAILDQAELEKDPEYQQWLKLNEKFGKKT